MRYFLLISVIAVLGISCGDDSPSDETIISSPYMPLTIGKYIDYRVTDITYRNAGMQIDTQTYLLREQVIAERMNDSEIMEYVIDRSTRPSDQDAWQYQESWRARYTDNQALRTEGNLTFVKLQLPIEDELTWDGNAYFDTTNPTEIGDDQIDYYKGWTSRYTTINTSVSINNQVYDGVVQVNLADSENRIELRRANESYAPGIGLVSREVSVLDTQCFDNCATIAWEKKAEAGHIYTQYIIDHN